MIADHRFIPHPAAPALCGRKTGGRDPLLDIDETCSQPEALHEIKAPSYAVRLGSPWSEPSYSGADEKAAIRAFEDARSDINCSEGYLFEENGTDPSRGHAFEEGRQGRLLRSFDHMAR